MMVREAYGQQGLLLNGVGQPLLAPDQRVNVHTPLVGHECLKLG
jgi:hypothetical protein